jgi:hypothetical protein
MSDLGLLVTRLTNAGVHRVYELNKVPSSPGYPYAVLGLDSGTPNGRTADSKAGKVHLFTVQLFGRDEDGLLDLAEMADTAFDGVAITELDDDPVAIRELSTSPYRDPDDSGVLNILHTYRY